MKTFLPILVFLGSFHFAYSQDFTEISAELNLAQGYDNGDYGAGVSMVDFNQDGLDDLTFPTGDGSTILFYKNTGIGFEEISPLVDHNLEQKQIHWVDYNNDGTLDLYLTSESTNRLYKNTGGLSFTDITDSCGFNDPDKQSFCGSWLDYDEDGLLDLCISHRISHLVGAITLYRNLGNDQFEDVTSEAGLSNLGNSVLAMATFDMNNDGWEDIFVGQDFQAGCLMLKNNGDGTFDDISISSNANIQNNTMSCTVGDYNNDGWMDIYLTNTSEGNTFLVNNGNETFTNNAIALNVSVDVFTWGAIFFDADNDADLDLHISAPSQSFMFENPGGELPFLDATAIWGFGNDFNYSVGAAIGDYNNDGFVDFSENNNYFSTHSFWQNNFTENNYLTVNLKGVVSNRMAVGALITIETNGKTQIRRVGCGEGFSSQNTYTQFFGLGANTIIDQVHVKWPNGLESTLTNVAVNQNIFIIEEIPPVAGCTDLMACNFDSIAVVDDGSCYFSEPFYDCNGLCLSDIDQDGICDELEILGCTDTIACNYNIDATEENGTCFYPAAFYDCDGFCLNDSDQDGICDELEVLGCTDSIACNYNVLATEDDGSCGYLETSFISGNLEMLPFETTSYSYPEVTENTYFWEISGGEIISGQGTGTIEVRWNLAGTGILTLTETNEMACQVEVQIEVDVILSYTRGAIQYGIQLFPIPVRNLLYVDLGEWEEESVFVEIFNIYGQSVFQKEIKRTSFATLNLHGFHDGVYEVTLIKGIERVVERIVFHEK